MRSFIMGGAIVVTALTVLALVALPPYMKKAGQLAVPMATVSDRSPPASMKMDSDKETVTPPLADVTTLTETSPPPAGPKPVQRSTGSDAVRTEPNAENMTLSRPAITSTAGRPLSCGSDPAAQDLAGRCRAKPCPTMGALEAPLTAAASSAEPICLADVIKSKITRGSTQKETKSRKKRPRQTKRKNRP